MEQNKDENAFFNKLKADDVWKESHCPIYISCSGPKTDKLPNEIFKCYDELKSDAKSNLQKLYDLISDPITRTSVVRICRLLYEYLHEVGGTGYNVKDLPLIISVLEFLAENVGQAKEYELHLVRMLDLCNIPPLLEKSSEILINCDIIEQYFSLLGKLLIILPTKRQTSKVRKAIRSLLLKTKDRNLSAIKPVHCRKAMEKSKLPLIVADLLRASLPDTYPQILELVLLLSSISCTCSRRMLEVNILNTIMTRMDLPYATQLRCIRPPNLLLTGNEYSDDTTLLILDTLWSLLKCVILPTDTPIDLGKNSKSAHCALWGLCYAFKRQVFYGQHRNFSAKVRNDIAMIILIISVSFPSWNLVSSGIAETVIQCLVGIESGTIKVFSNIIKFGRTNEDLYFEKILLLIVAQLTEIDACIYLMEREKLMETMLQLVNPSTLRPDSTWSPPQFWNLWTHVMSVLSLLVQKMPNKFMDNYGSVRLYMLLEWCLSSKIDVKVIMSCIKTIYTIILCDNIFLLESFREHGIILLLMKLINYTLTEKKLTMEEQRVITLSLMSIEKLMEKQSFYREVHGEYSIIFIMELLFRCFYQKEEEFQVDQRLLLAVGSYIWNCIIWCPSVLEKFIEYGGVYVILDIIETAPYYCCCLFLAVLCDICDNFFCGSFLCTWRGSDKKIGLMSLLAKLWREEEIRDKAKRNMDGTVKDEQLPIISKKQWLETYRSKLNRDVSPAIVDMIGSIRSKIHSICKIVERDNGRYEIAKQHYKMLHADLSLEDRITISTIELYFTLKLGQVWVEITNYFEQVGIDLLGIDSQALFFMTQRYYLLGSMIKNRQTRIVDSVKNEEDIKEKDEYERIRESKLILSLDAFDELDYIYRTMNRSYMLRKKKEQIEQVDMALNFPSMSDDAQCHRTFQDEIAVTTVFNQHQTIRSGLTPDVNLSQMRFRLPDISPCDSHISDKEYYSKISLPSLSKTCLVDLEKFMENE